MKNNTLVNNVLTGILLLAPVVLLFIIFRSPDILIYDEKNFVSNLPLLQKYGLSTDFLCALRNQSPGPLYQFIYYPLKFIGIDTIKEFRVVNLLFLCGCVCCIYKLMKTENVEHALNKALLLFCIPLTWATAGLALTEMPTMFFALTSMLVLKIALVKQKGQLWLLLLAGLLLGLSIIGRSPFLTILPAAGYLFISMKKPPNLSVIAFFIAALVMPLILFFIWKGLVPPAVQKIQSGISFSYLIVSFSYLCFFVLFLCPQFYKIPTLYYKLLGVLLLLLLLLNLIFLHIDFMPMKTMDRLLPASLRIQFDYWFSLCMPCVISCLALLHIIALWYQVKNSGENKWQLFLLISATLLVLTTLKSSAQFSARYPFQAIPFLLLYCGKYIKVTPGLVVRVLIGISLGVVSIMGYYHFET